MSLTNAKDLYFVSCAGTGASLMGIRQSLIESGFSVKICLVEPYGCDSKNKKFKDHKFEGMSVGVSPPFIDWNVINRIIYVNFEDALEEKKYLAKKLGHLVGNTSAACILASRIIEQENPNVPVLTIVYDHGLWYDDLVT